MINIQVTLLGLLDIWPLLFELDKFYRKIQNTGERGIVGFNTLSKSIASDFVGDASAKIDAVDANRLWG